MYQIPTCLSNSYFEKDCGPPEIAINATVQKPTGTTYNSVAEYYCTIGYSMTGNNTRQCTVTGDWSGVVPSCNIIGKIYKRSFVTVYHNFVLNPECVFRSIKLIE